MNRSTNILLAVLASNLAGCFFVKPAALFKSDVPPVPYETIYVAPGTFTMGSPASEAGREANEAQRQVTISRGFHMMKTEVTQALYQSMMKDNPSFFQRCGMDCPIEMVTWHEAIFFANVLSEHEGREICYESKGPEILWPNGFNCKGWRLPTEAEWEFAARGGGDHQFSGSNDMDEVAWYGYSKSGKTPHPGCQKKQNGYGFCDMSGNVSEWVWNVYGTDVQESATDPKGAKTGDRRGHRGGGWFDGVGFIRTANRNGIPPNELRNIIGIRLVRTAEP